MASSWKCSCDPVAAIQVDRRDAVVDVRPSEEAVEVEAGWRTHQTQRKNGDAVPVVVEGGLVDQRRADNIRGVDDAGVGRIAEGVGNGWYVVAAPHGGAIVLGDLLGNEVTIDRELVIHVFVDADDFFPHVGGHVITALELGAIGRLGEDTAVFATGSQEGL